MKKIIIVLMVLCAALIGVAKHTTDKADKACSLAQCEKFEADVIMNFYSLSEKWGDDVRCDTLLSNAQWAKIDAHDVTVGEAIALASLVEEAYDMNCVDCYADVIDDSDFREAVKKYIFMKEYISENRYNK